MSDWKRYSSGRVRARLVDDSTVEVETRHGSPSRPRITQVPRGIFEALFVETVVREKRGKKILIDEVTYPSVKAAARALGVNYSSLYSRVELVPGQRDLYHLPNPICRRRPVVIEGVEFDSVSDAARGLGCSRNRIYRLLRKGKARVI